MTEARVAIQGGTNPANTNVTWNVIDSNAISLPPFGLVDLSGVPTGWTLGREATGVLSNTTTGGPTAPTAPASDWVDENIIAREANFTGNDVEYQFTGLNDADSYTIEFYGARESATGIREIEVSANYDFTNSQTLNVSGNTGATLVFSGLSPTTGALTLYTRRSATSQGDPYHTALRIYDAATPVIRKSSTFDIETNLSGTVTAATLNGNAITVDSQTGTTVTLTDSGSGIATSGQYNLVLTDNSVDPDETITVQVNVVGVAPSNNPLQKDGAALASLTGVQVRVTNGANINGTELYYSGAATTDISGNLGNIDLSSTAVVDTDPVLLHMRTAAGDSIIASETVGLI